MPSGTGSLYEGYEYGQQKMGARRKAEADAASKMADDTRAALNDAFTQANTLREAATSDKYDPSQAGALLDAARMWNERYSKLTGMDMHGAISGMINGPAPGSGPVGFETSVSDPSGGKQSDRFVGPPPPPSAAAPRARPTVTGIPTDPVRAASYFSKARTAAQLTAQQEHGDRLMGAFDKFVYDSGGYGAPGLRQRFMQVYGEAAEMYGQEFADKAAAPIIRTMDEVESTYAARLKAESEALEKGGTERRLIMKDMNQYLDTLFGAEFDAMGNMITRMVSGTESARNQMGYFAASMVGAGMTTDEIQYRLSDMFQGTDFKVAKNGIPIQPWKKILEQATPDQVATANRFWASGHNVEWYKPVLKGKEILFVYDRPGDVPVALDPKKGEEANPERQGTSSYGGSGRSSTREWDRDRIMGEQPAQSDAAASAGPVKKGGGIPVPESVSRVMSGVGRAAGGAYQGGIEGLRGITDLIGVTDTKNRSR